MKNLGDRIAFILFLFSIAFVVFAYGVVAHKYNLFPYSTFVDAYKTLTASTEQEHFLQPVRYDRVGAKTYKPDEVTPGLTLLTSYWQDHDWRPGIRLIDREGNKLHHWELLPDQIWPESPYKDAMAGETNKANNYVHGSYLFPNGDVLVNIEYLGLVRMNACGEVVWKLPYRTHHSIDRAEDGNFWISGVIWHDKSSKRLSEFPGLRPPIAEDTIVKVSPDGKVLQEISILKALFDANYQYLLFKYQTITGDVTHINDVEALTVEMAEKFQMFNAGDLVISLKHISSVAVLDQNGKIKWLNSQEFNRQHDPDFENDGSIVVFDNREDTTDTGKFLGGSWLTAINPLTNEAKPIYPTNDSQFFFTNAGGKHQLFDNGNRLISEVRAARIFEINSAGETVWEWINQPYSRELVPEVMEGARYNISPEVVADWACK